MASSVGNSGFNINQQFANQLGRGDSKVADNLRNQSGVTHTAKKTHVSKGGRISEEGSNLSPAAREALKTQEQQHSDEVAEHGQELAHQSGLDVQGDDQEEQEVRNQHSYEREQERLAEGPTADGKNYVLTSPNGAKQVMKVEDHQYLNSMDDADFTDAQVLDDIPAKNLEAANAVLDTQMTKGVSKVAVLKGNPEIDQVAEQMETAPAPPLAEPLDIRDTTNDPKSQPLQIELPVEMEQIAAEKAARELASGDYQQEAMIAGGLPGTQANIKPESAPGQELQNAQQETLQNDKILAKLQAGTFEIEGKNIAPQDGYDALRNNAQDRLQTAFTELNPAAQHAIQIWNDTLKERFLQVPDNTYQWRRLSEKERGLAETRWMAQSVEKYFDDPTYLLNKFNHYSDVKIDPATRTNLQDGARQFKEADVAYQKLVNAKDSPKVSRATTLGGTNPTSPTQVPDPTTQSAVASETPGPGVTATPTTESVSKPEEATTVIKTDGPFPTAQMPDTATTSSLKQFSDPLIEARMNQARSQLSPGQKADLSQLEGDIAKIRSLYQDMGAKPDDKDFLTKSQAEIATIQTRIGEMTNKYNKPGPLQLSIDPKDGEVYTHLSWSNPQISSELRQQGYQNMYYTLTSVPGKNDYQLTAKPVNQYGQTDGNYVQYRVASDDPKRWQGVAAIVGNQYGSNGFSTCTTAVDDPTLRTQLTTNTQAITPGQAAVIKQALGDVKLNWPGGAGSQASPMPQQPGQPIAPGYLDYMRYSADPSGGFYNQGWSPSYPSLPYMNGYNNYMSYPPINYGGMPMGGWNSWGGMGMGGMGMGGMDFTMKMFAVSSLINSLSFPLMMFSMF